MKSFFSPSKTICIIVILLLFHEPGYAQVQKHKPVRSKAGDIDILTFENGLRVLVNETKDTSVLNITALVRAGYAYDPEDKLGLSYMLPVTFQTYVRDMSTLMSIDLSAWVYKDYVWISITSLEEHAKEALFVMYDTLINPDIDRWVYNAMDIVRDRQRQAKENISYQLISQFNKQLFPEHPYGNMPAGTIKTLSKIRTSDLSEFHQKYYTPRNMVVSVVGDISARKTSKCLKERFGRWYKVHEDLPELPGISEPPQKKLLVNHSPDLEDAYVVFGQRGLNFNDPAYPVLRVIGSLLDSPTEYGIRYHLREMKGFSYSAFAEWETMLHAGSLLGNFCCAPEYVAEALPIAVGCIQRLRTEKVKNDVLESVKKHFYNLETIRSEHESQLAYELAFAELFGLDYDFRDQWLKKIDDITPESLLQSAQKLLQPEKLQIIIMGNKDKIGKLNGD